MSTKKPQNTINVSLVKKCLPVRAKVTVRNSYKGAGTPSGKPEPQLEVFCDPPIKEKEWPYIMQSIEQVMSVREFYSEEQGRHFFIYPNYDKKKPIKFITSKK